MSSPTVVRELSPHLLAFLHGTTQASSPLTKLRGHNHLLRIIWEIVCEEWMALHIEHFPVDLTLHRIPELLPWERPRDDDGIRRPEYPHSRQQIAGCPVVVLEKNLPFPPLYQVPPDRFKHQQTEDLYVNMMPFDLLSELSLPLECRQYWPMIEACNRMIDFRDGGYTIRGPRIGYLTIDERPVPSGSSQRRPGLHVESPGVMPVIQSVADPTKAQYRMRTANGTYIPGAEHHWGGGMLMRREYVEGGIFMASNVAGTTAVWNSRINDEDGEFIGAHGDIERFRGLLGPCARTLEAGELIWMTDRTPHESLPIPASAGSQRRQYFRLVVGQVSAWYADHCTPNPLGTVPPSGVHIVYGDKFTLYPALRHARSWHCGTTAQMKAIRDFEKVRMRLNLFGLGHMSQRAYEYGLTSPVKLVTLFKQQGGLPKGNDSDDEGAYYRSGDVNWSMEFSADKKTHLFDTRGSYYYDRGQFYDMVCSFTKLMETVVVKRQTKRH